MMKYIMVILKKLIFAPIFLIVFGLLIYRLVPTIKSYDFIFSLSVNTLTDLIILSALIGLTSLFFVLFITIASDWKITLPVSIISAAVPFVFAPPALALIFAVAIFVSLLLVNLSLNNTLKSYLTFEPTVLLGPSIRHLSSFLILSFCLVYFLSSSKMIVKDGFQIPDSLIDTALKMAPVNPSAEQNSTTQVPAISPAQNLTNDLIKQTVKDQIQNFIKPYLSFIPAVLAVLLFLTLQSLTSILNLLIYPLLWVIFFIFKKTGFVKFEIEQRPVKKLVV